MLKWCFVDVSGFVSIVLTRIFEMHIVNLFHEIISESWVKTKSKKYQEKYLKDSQTQSVCKYCIWSMSLVT